MEKVPIPWSWVIDPSEVTDAHNKRDYGIIGPEYLDTYEYGSAFCEQSGRNRYVVVEVIERNDSMISNHVLYDINNRRILYFNHG